MAFAVSQKKSRSGGLSQVIADVIGSNDVLSAVSAQGLCLTGLTAAIASAEQRPGALQHAAASSLTAALLSCRDS